MSHVHVFIVQKCKLLIWCIVSATTSTCIYLGETQHIARSGSELNIVTTCTMIL